MENIILFGMGREYQKNIELLKKLCNIIAVSDNAQRASKDAGYVSPSDVCKLDFDKIVITPKRRNIVNTIKKQLSDMGISESKVCCLEEYLHKYDVEKFQKDKVRYIDLYEQSCLGSSMAVSEEYLCPIVNEWRDCAGDQGSYFWQDLWGAMQVVKSGVSEHYDIGSRIDGFIAHLIIAGIRVNMIDIRPLKYQLPNVHFVQSDATDLCSIKDSSIESLSALHSLEHFGLGRYGDPIDPLGCFRAFKAIERVMKPNGKIYLAFPIGLERVEFNGCRIFNPQTIIHCFPEMELLEFSFIDLQNTEKPLKRNVNIDSSLTIEGTGLFVFKKK